MSEIGLSRPNFGRYHRVFLMSAMIALVCLSARANLSAREPVADPTQSESEEKPIKAMLITGGCCHDYQNQKRIITEGIAARCKIKIEWTIVHQGGSTTNARIPLFEDKDWAAGYDVVIHNECFAQISDKEWVERVLKPHREGVNAMVIHCAMHTFRDLKDNAYRDFLGVTSRSHGPHHSFKVENMAPQDPIMKGFGKEWNTPKGELYYVDSIGAKATPLARAFSSGGRKKQEVCIWKNQYGKARVFGTTIGHHNETMSAPRYLDFLTRGFLWSVGRLDEKHLKAPPTRKVPINLALRKPATASANQPERLPRAATDGSTATRYCADDNAPGDWWQVDLGKPQKLTGVQIHWEQGNRLYRFKLEGSADGKSWKLLHDGTKNQSREQTQNYPFQADKIRYVRITCTETESGAWFSFFEFRVHGTEMVEVAQLGPVGALTPPEELLADLKHPESFQAKIFAAPPDVNYPVCLTATYDGVVFVGVDQNGSLDRKPGRGHVIRCLDDNGDGIADRFTKFCKVDSPRGLVWDRDRLYVLHPPDLSVYFDDDGDGVADRKETLVKGIGFDLNFRGADHTTNGIRMGIDGKIYVAVGDYGFIKATGSDGKSLQLKGGGVVRVNPDGSELEVFARGLRNICDVAIDPRMNLYTRDNTNDGGGWDIRVSHVIGDANFGYPSLYKNFNAEIMPPMADYGGGSGTGALFVSNSNLPEKYRQALFTCDWGRSKIFYHPLTPDGATYSVEQEDFLTMTRPTDMDIDARGNLYVASWRGGQFKYAGENIGYVAVLQPRGAKVAVKLPDLMKAKDADLARLLFQPNDSLRLAVSREIRFRMKSGSKYDFLTTALVASDKPDVQIAALYLAGTLPEPPQFSTLSTQLHPNAVPTAIRVLAPHGALKKDDANSLEQVAQWLGVEGSAPLRADAQMAVLQVIAKQGIEGATPAVLKFAGGLSLEREKDKGVKTPVNTSDRALRHVAVRTLATLNQTSVLLNSLQSPVPPGSQNSASAVAFDALKSIHSQAAVDGLIRLLQKDPGNQAALETLMRLFYMEGPYTGKWWGTRPDTRGPYYSRVEWRMSDTIRSFLIRQIKLVDQKTRQAMLTQAARHQLKIPELMVKAEPVKAKPEMTVKIPEFDKNNPAQLGNIDYATVSQQVAEMKGKIGVGRKLFLAQSCAACHAVEKSAAAIGPQLIDIGKRYKRAELVQSILQPNAKIAQGFATQVIATDDGLTHVGFVTKEAGDSIELRNAEGKSVVIERGSIENRREAKNSVMPEGLVSNLTVKELASLLAYLESLKSDVESGGK